MLSSPRQGRATPQQVVVSRPLKKNLLPRTSKSGGKKHVFRKISPGLQILTWPVWHVSVVWREELVRGRKPRKSRKSFCLFQIILRRENGDENFYRNWKSYKKGFGRQMGEFWFGKQVNLNDVT